MNRRSFVKSSVLSAAVMSSTAMPTVQAEEVAKKMNGLPPLTIKDVEIITTNGGSHYRWVFVKIITSEPGLYGIGTANNHYETTAVISGLQDHLKPFLIGKDPARIEDLWQAAQMSTYWRNGPVNNNMLAAMDMALWDIKGKRANMPVYELFGGKARDGVAVYDHQGGNTKEECLEALQRSLANGYKHVRIQLGNYGGGGFTPEGQGNRVEGGYKGRAFDEFDYINAIPPLFEYLRNKVGFEPRLLHDVHSHLSGMNAAEFARRMQPYEMFFLEDILPPEQLAYYRNIREICTTPQAVGEVFSHPLEVLPLITDRLIDFMRCRVAAIGGITPIRKLVNLCEIFGVHTAFQEGGENDPVNQMAAYHVDISTSAFGIQEENHFPQSVHDMFPGIAEIRRGYLYGSDRPGLGLDINQELAAKYPIGPISNGGAYPTDRKIDGTVVKP